MRDLSEKQNQNAVQGKHVRIVQEEVPPRSLRKKRKKVILAIVCTLLAVLLIAGGAFAFYLNNLSNALSYKGDSDELSDALVAAEKNDPFYILVIGTDNERSDVMVLVRFDLDESKLTMVSVPRDTPYHIDGNTVKLNQVFAEEGEAACIQAVSQLTGVSISHYIEVGFDQLKDVVDELGGVDVDVPYAIDGAVWTSSGYQQIRIGAGENHLSGEEALILARSRMEYSYNGITQDAIRQANIRAIMMDMLKQVLSKPVLEIPGQIQILASMVETDIPFSDLVYWATTLAGGKQLVVYSCTGPTEGDLDEDTGLWLTTEAPEQWARIMTEVNAGRDPSKVMERTTSTDGAVHVGTTEVIDVGGEESGDSAGAGESETDGEE